MAGLENDVLVAKNMNFDEDAAKPHLGIIDAAGKIPIGTGNSFPTPEILAGSLTSPDASLTVGYSSPNITLAINNTNKPFVSAYRSTTMTNFTGDNTSATVIFDTETADITNSYNNATGVFTAPISGNYQISATVTYTSVDATYTLGNLQIATSGAGITQMFVTCNPGKLFNVNGNYTSTVTANIGIVAGTTVSIDTRISGGAKTVGISGTAFGVFTYLNILYIRP